MATLTVPSLGEFVLITIVASLTFYLIQGNELMRRAVEHSFKAIKLGVPYLEAVRARQDGNPLRWDHFDTEARGNEHTTNVRHHLRRFVFTSLADHRDAHAIVERWNRTWQGVYRAEAGFTSYSDTESERLM